MKDYEHIYNCYMKEFIPFMDKVEAPVWRLHSDEDVGLIIKDLNFYQGIGYMLHHRQYGGNVEYANYIDKYKGYNWLFYHASKYLGKARKYRYQQLRDAAYALNLCRPDLNHFCEKLIRSIEKDIAEDVRKEHPELNALIPQEKIFVIPKIHDDDYAAGYRAGWNEFAKAMTAAHNMEAGVNHLIYSMHEVAMEWEESIHDAFIEGQDDMRKDYEQYVYDLETYGEDDPWVKSNYRNPPEYPNDLPPDKTYEEILFELAEEYNAHRTFHDMIQYINRPEIEQIQQVKEQSGKSEKDPPAGTR